MKTLGQYVVATLSGLVFGIGLIIAGMANPAKVLAFLDLAGAWDPSLAFVMVGAISVSAISFFLLRGRTDSFLGFELQWPKLTQIDQRLVIGNLLFGLGWGLAGICPGPALVLVGTGALKGIGFCAAMLLGFVLCDVISKRIKN